MGYAEQSAQPPLLDLNQPIDRIKWIQADQLEANDWNPNVVLKDEMRLLKFSLIKTGWIQPVLIDGTGVIIDGFHRWWLSLKDEDVRAAFKGWVPCAVLDISVPARMLMTVRINRAKGSHVAVKMHELVTRLFRDHGVPKDRIAREIGGSVEEVDLLLQENVFTKLDTKAHKYSMAWVPKIGGQRGKKEKAD